MIISTAGDDENNTLDITESEETHSIDRYAQIYFDVLSSAYGPRGIIFWPLLFDPNRAFVIVNLTLGTSE
jgi:hypothetical protein